MNTLAISCALLCAVALVPHVWAACTLTTTELPVIGVIQGLQNVNGTPALIYTSDVAWNDTGSQSTTNTTKSKIFFLKADNAEGTSWGAPVDILNATINVRYDSDGSAIEDARVAFAIINGYPAIAFADRDDTSGRPLRYVRAVDRLGSLWLPMQTIPAPTNTTKLTVTLAGTQTTNIPAVCWASALTVSCIRGRNSRGTSWSNLKLISNSSSPTTRITESAESGRVGLGWTSGGSSAQQELPPALISRRIISINTNESLPLPVCQPEGTSLFYSRRITQNNPLIVTVDGPTDGNGVPVRIDSPYLGAANGKTAMLYFKNPYTLKKTVLGLVGSADNDADLVFKQSLDAFGEQWPQSNGSNAADITVAESLPSISARPEVQPSFAVAERANVSGAQACPVVVYQTKQALFYAQSKAESDGKISSFIVNSEPIANVSVSLSLLTRRVLNSYNPLKPSSNIAHIAGTSEDTAIFGVAYAKSSIIDPSTVRFVGVLEAQVKLYYTSLSCPNGGCG